MDNKVLSILIPKFIIYYFVFDYLLLTLLNYAIINLI